MVAEVMLINPRRKRRVTRVKRNPRRKMTALQAKYFGPRKKRRSVSRTATTVRSNPVRKRRRRRSIIRARRNPISVRKATGSITSALMPAAIGAGGALALNYGFNAISGSLPSSFTSGYGGAVAQIALSMGLGMVAGMVFGKTIGTQVAAGAITVTVYSLAQSAMGNSSNNGNYNALTGMAGLGVRPRLGPPRMGRYVGKQMGLAPANLNGMGLAPRNLNGLAAQPARMRRRMNGLGYMGPARVAQMGRYVGRNN